MSYTALHMSARPGNDHTRHGFSSEKDAMSYIYQRCCKACRDDIDRGYCVEESDSFEVQDAMATSCGAEWDIITDSEYDDLLDSESNEE